jgi:hypothetical protein
VSWVAPFTTMPNILFFVDLVALKCFSFMVECAATSKKLFLLSFNLLNQLPLPTSSSQI